MKRQAIIALLTTGIPALSSGQEPIPLIGVDVDLAHYGILAPERVTRGRVSIAYAPEGPRLTAYWLRDTPPPPRIAAEPPDAGYDAALEAAAGPRARQRAMWVWNTREILDEPAERAAFLSFVERRRISRVFLYLASAPGRRPEAGFIPFDGAEIGPLLSALGDRGALAYALDGDRDYVLPENHEGVYRTVRSLVAHNRSVPADQRFYGVRYDIEPYLAPGFQGPDRQRLLDLYAELVAGVARIAHEGGMAAAVDVPFWFDSPDEETGAYLEAVVDGRRRPILEHVMEHVDDVAVMDYRTMAEGPNGALVHAWGEMALGARADVGVFVGVETTRLLDEDLQTFSGPPEPGLPDRADARWVVLEGLEGTRARLWLVDGPEALAELRTRAAGSRSLRHWPAGRPARVAADLQSFHDLGAEAMERVTGQVVDSLSARAAFLGLAYHDYRGLRALLERR